ncbi:hypothetical protein GCM10023083_29050 [Streptomyces phyllanthi]
MPDVPVAMALPRTALGLAGHRRHAWLWIGAGLSAVVIGLAVGPSADEAGIGWLSDMAVFCVGGGPVAVAVGGATLVNCRRMRRVLAAHPWTACAAVGIPPGLGSPRVVLRHPASGDLILLTVSTVAPRYHLANPDPGGVLWWCGDPRTGGVLAQPGGEGLLWARRTRTARTRRSDVQAAEQQGLMDRPSPVQPQTPAGDMAGHGKALDLSYAAMVEPAARRGFPGPDGASPPHAPDIRVLPPWWRVRALLEVSQLWPTAVNAAFAVAMLLTWWLLARDAEIDVPLILAALSAFNALRFGRRAVHGVPAVKALVRAARAPVPVPRRYVLLPGLDDGLVLVFFPAHGGPDDLPEAAMEVNPPGTSKHPWRGMPPQVGIADLRGWLDDGPTVVPWIEGRPLWPRHRYETVNLNDQQDREYFAALVGGASAQVR